MLPIAASAFLLAFTATASAFSPDEDMKTAVEAREFAQAIAIADTCDIEMDMRRVGEVAGRFAKSDVIHARMFLESSGRAHKVRFESMTAPEQAAACSMARETARKHGLMAEGGSVEAEPSTTGDMNDCKAADAKRSVRACTALIESSDFGSEVRAMAYVLRATTRMKQGFQRGIDPLDENTLQLVIGDLNGAIRLKPDYARAYALRGASRGDMGQFDQAISDFDEAIRLDPDDADAYYGRGRAHLARGHIAKAVADYTKAIRLKPDDADPYLSRGLAYMETGDYPRAIDDYTRVIQLQPDSALAYTNRALSHERSGNTAQARADYRAALAVPQHDSDGVRAHETARERLKALGAEPPPQDAADQQVVAAPTVPVPAKSGRAQVASLTPRQVFSHLTDRYTEAQREAWFETHADGKRVSWRMRVSDVSEGWFNYDVSGMFGPTRQVICKVDITDETRAFMLDVNKGATVDCIGTLATYTKVLGTVTLLVDDAVIRK